MRRRFDRPMIVLLLITALVAIVPFFAQPYFTRLATGVLVYGLAAISLDIIVGYGGMVSFGHAAFFGLGAYAAAILNVHGVHSAFLVMPSAIVVAALAAFIIGGISLRTSGVYFIMITLAFAQMLYYLAGALVMYGGHDGLKMPRNTYAGLVQVEDPAAFFYIVLAVFVLVVLASRRLVQSRFGRVLRAIKDNDVRAQSLGFDSYRYQLVAFVIAGGLAGLAGMLHANLYEYVGPDLLHWILSGDLLVMLILGGAGTLVGPVLGAATFLLLQEVLSGYTRHWPIVLGPLLLCVVLFSSGGLYGLFKSNVVDD